MTIRPCPANCGEYFENDVAVCPKCGASDTLTIAFAMPVAATPEAVGAEIRRLLFSLRAPGHTAEAEREGNCDYGSDILRATALDAAGICWHGSGKMFSAAHPCNGRPKQLDDFKAVTP